MIPNHIKIGNAEKFISQYISEHSFSKIGFLVDSNSADHCLKQIEQKFSFDFHVITISDGEENKNLSTCEKVWQELINLKFDRNSLLINVGGGVVCDLGGFVASTYMRGIDFINVPTTLLSQVDASVGGKLGVDFNNLKNIIGTFKEPSCVIIDTNFLKTLSEKELKSGFAEVIKHCLIRDKKMFDKISKFIWSENNWDEIIKHSISIKSEVVNKDLKESGLRKILNFGHTIGHAIETTYLNKYKKMLHGEAISIGLICESYISYHHQKINSSDLKLITDYIFNIYKLPKLDSVETIVQNTYHDKKNINQNIKICILNGIGDCEYDIKINEDLIYKSLEYYNQKCDE